MITLNDKQHGELMFYIGGLLELSEKGDPLNPKTKAAEKKIMSILLPDVSTRVCLTANNIRREYVKRQAKF
jgi:hypothetical protein